MSRNPFDLIPVRWPASWGHLQPEKLSGGVVNCIVVDKSATEPAGGPEVLTLDQAPAALLPNPRWPGIQITAEGNQASAGPTGIPWVNANGYAIQLALALDPSRPVWLDYRPPAGLTVSDPAIELAICDAAAYGAHWLVHPELASWAAIERGLAFFAAHAAWRDYKPVAHLAVVSDFAKQRAFTLEVLNLLARRQLPYTIVPSSQLGSTDLNAFRAVLIVGEIQPGDLPPYRGLLIRPATRDPYEVAASTHLQLGRVNDLIRTWNGGSLNAVLTSSPDGHGHLLQLINYAAANPSWPVSVGLAGSYRAARLYTLDGEAQRLPIQQVRSGIELQLPAFPVYAAVELTR